MTHFRLRQNRHSSRRPPSRTPSLTVFPCAVLACLILIGLTGPVAAEDKWRPERYRLTVPNPEPGEARTRLQLLKLEKKPATPSPTATELLRPIIRVVEKVSYKHRATISVRDASLLNNANHLGLAPDQVTVVARVEMSEDLGKDLRPVHFAIAQRSLVSLSKYKMSANEVYGKVCLMVPRLAAPEKGIVGTLNFKMPASELLKLDVRERDMTRFAGLMTEHAQGEVIDLDGKKGFDVSRFQIDSALNVSWNRSNKALLAQGIPQDGCVLTIVLKKSLPPTQHARYFVVPKTKDVLTAKAFQIRVAPLTQRLYGKPVIRKRLTGASK